jgi:hypothetical protein
MEEAKPVLESISRIQYYQIIRSQIEHEDNLINQDCPPGLGRTTATSWRRPLSPYAALLWLEFVSGPEAQSLIESGYKGSIFSAGTTAFQVARTNKVSLVDWQHYTRMQEYLRLVVEAYGFPKAEAVGKSSR